MKRFIFSILGCIFALSTNIEANIQTCSSLTDCIKEVSLKQGDLLVLDIDLTLIVPTESVLLYPQIKRHRKVFKHLAEWTPLLKMITLNLIPKRYASQVIEKSIPQLIQFVKSQGVPVIALTSCLVNSLGDELLAPQMRFEQLKSHDIFLSNPISSDSLLELEDLELAMGYYPMYYQGILVANTIDNPYRVVNAKGEVLKSFLKHLPFIPTRIIFVDDRQDNLESVEHVLQDMGIEYSGWLYNRADILSTEDVTEEQFIKVWGALINEAKEIIAEQFLEEVI